ncbi:MAG TPA: IS200/IS605 family transposase [Ferruginibacter sp.]|nr:IS200/IS605 family transposase [Ferruginibacter sp.]
MPNTYIQIHVHFIFAVKYREATITNWKDELYKYITGIVQNNNHKMIAINGMPDHVHILIGIRPTQSISELLQNVKGNSSKWINEKKFTKKKFEWQEGYGAFSYGRSQLKDVITYIEDQEQHHSKKLFRQEYINFLEKFEVDYDERYIFKDLI